MCHDKINEYWQNVNLQFYRNKTQLFFTAKCNCKHNSLLQNNDFRCIYILFQFSELDHKNLVRQMRNLQN